MLSRDELNHLALTADVAPLELYQGAYWYSEQVYSDSEYLAMSALESWFLKLGMIDDSECWL